VPWILAGRCDVLGPGCPRGTATISGVTIPKYCESITLYSLAVIEEKIQETLEKVCSSY
jgi:hypothetical protein